MSTEIIAEDLTPDLTSFLEVIPSSVGADLEGAARLTLEDHLLDLIALPETSASVRWILPDEDIDLDWRLAHGLIPFLQKQVYYNTETDPCQ